MKTIKSITVITYAVILLACGPSLFTSLKLAITAFGPTAQVLVSHGVITQAQADNIKQDANDAVDVSAQLNASLATATATGQKLIAWKAASDGWTLIVARGHFANIPYINDAAVLVDGIFDTALAFYGGTPNSAAKGKLGARRGVIAHPVDEKALNAHIKAQIDAINAQLKAVK